MMRKYFSIGLVLLLASTLIACFSFPSSVASGYWGPSDVPDVIESTIDGKFEGWKGETIFKLTNGQIWQQAEYAYLYHYAYRPEVLIYKSSSGYIMKVDGVSDEIRVKLVRGTQASTSRVPMATPTVIESRISGTFEGWDGGTVFKLMNGQIWQQAEYSYYYHYAYMPGVLIFKKGTGYVMRIEGTNKEIRVKRIK